MYNLLYNILYKKVKKMTLGDIIKQFGITPGAALTMIGRLECGKSEMGNTTFRTALALADALDADPQELMQK